jgi:hypothetical protein
VTAPKLGRVTLTDQERWVARTLAQAIESDQVHMDGPLREFCIELLRKVGRPTVADKRDRARAMKEVAWSLGMGFARRRRATRRPTRRQ